MWLKLLSCYKYSWEKGASNLSQHKMFHLINSKYVVLNLGHCATSSAHSRRYRLFLSTSVLNFLFTTFAKDVVSRKLFLKVKNTSWVFFKLPRGDKVISWRLKTPLAIQEQGEGTHDGPAVTCIWGMCEVQTYTAEPAKSYSEACVSWIVAGQRMNKWYLPTTWIWDMVTGNFWPPSLT